MAAKLHLPVVPALVACALTGPPSPAHTPFKHRQHVASDTVTIRVREGTGLTFDLTPDGRFLVMDLLGQLWEVPRAGGKARALTDAVRDTADDRQPSVSPDGLWIAARSDRPRGRGIWLHRHDGGSHREVTDSAMFLGDDVGVPVWAPDGKRLAYVREDSILITDTAGGPPVRLTPSGMKDSAFDEPSWSPDGHRLAVSGPWQDGSARAYLDGPRGAGIWEVDLANGRSRRVTPEGVAARAPAYSPGGRELAFFVADSSGGFHLDVQAIERARRTITREPGIEPRRVRWSPEGDSLFFVASGRLRKVAAAGGASVEVPFEAELRVPRERYTPAPVRFPEAGRTVQARGFTGLALSPDGRSIAMLALGRLWLIHERGAPRPLASVPPTASGLAWSPDSRQIVWEGLGSTSAEDLWITDVASGISRRLTALPGEEGGPAWSPDGKWIAFLHWPKSQSSSPPWSDDDGTGHVRLVAGDLTHPATLQETTDLGEIPWGEMAVFAAAPQWTPHGEGVLVYGVNGWPVRTRTCAEAALYGRDGPRRAIGRFPCRPAHAVIGSDGSLTAVERGVLVRHSVVQDGWGDAQPLGTDAALYPSLARDGTLLYVAPNGLRLRQPGVAERLLGWPVTFRVPVPPALLVRNVHVAAIDASADTGLRDLLIEQGLIRRIAPAGSLPRATARRVIDANGRWAIPGLIDAHGHLGDAMAPVRADLYSGVTTMREMWQPLGDAAAERDAVDAGVANGARVVVSGPPFYPSPTGESLTSDFVWIPVDSATGERGLAMLAGFGAGHLKMRYVQTWNGGASLVRQAHRHGLRVSGHCAHGLPLVMAGVDGHEHLDGQCGDWEFGVHDDLVQLYRAAGVAVTPVIDYHAESARTARDTSRIHAPDVEPFLTPSLRLSALLPPTPGLLARIESRARRARQTTRAMHAAGVRIALGTDEPAYPGGVHRELEELVASGLSPRDALRAATVDAAAVIGASGQIGRLAPGYLADLVLLDGDPLSDIRNTRRIWAVVQGGRVVDRDGLRRGPCRGGDCTAR